MTPTIFTQCCFAWESGKFSANFNNSRVLTNTTKLFAALRSRRGCVWRELKCYCCISAAKNLNPHHVSLASCGVSLQWIESLSWKKKDWLTDDQSRPMPCLQSFQPFFSQSKVGLKKIKICLFGFFFRSFSEKNL